MIKCKDCGIEFSTMVMPSNYLPPHPCKRDKEKEHCPQCHYFGKPFGNLGLLACETPTCPVVTFKGWNVNA